ncbi:sodium-dependent multivitamin transporter-like, partial [Ruditapes philippinarum]|uniref:sodium-dependent multivitamin transporter-like n=1 Tax=Ruditapes philippinarum TaxID=129788 RepID=UPI00295B9DA1
MSSGPYSYQTGTSKTFHWADYAVFGTTLAISASIGIFYAIKDRNKNTTEEYLLAGRSMHPLPVAMSLLSSFISAITILGTPAEVYVYSTMYWWISVAFIITAIGAAHIFIPVFYNLGITSVFEYAEMRFGRTTRIIACIIYLLWMMFYMAIVLYAPSLALNAVTGLSLWGSVLAVSLVCIFYTALGGMKAVLWADTVQMTIVFAGMLTILIEGCKVLGGLDKAWDIANKNGRIVIFEFNTDPRIRHSVW